MREWIVVLEKGIDYNSFWDEIENDSPDDGFIPSRRVDIVNERPGMRRMCHYLLSDAEAEELRNDDRVLSVELPFEDEDNDEVITLGLDKTFDYKRNISVIGHDEIASNWGLIRCNYRDNPSDYTNHSYSLDGTGVDVVIIDTGIVADHPEWEDENGVSRLQQIDWFAESGVSGTQNPRHYEDVNGHGTHCAGIVAGKTFGWAKNARIYAIAMGSFILGGGNPNGIQSTSQIYDVLLGWHNNKPIDPSTGYKRPTIVNCSWNVTSFNDWDDERFVTWRGTRYAWSEFGNSDNTVWEKTGLRPRFGLGRVGGVNSNFHNVSFDELIDAGIHICNSAGNDFRTMSGPGDIDYNNLFEYFVPQANRVISSSNAWRPGAPYVQGRMFTVGNIDSTLDVATQKDRKSGSSNSGPAVNIFAPGTNIMSAYTSAGTYHADNNYHQAVLSGTSMASPQVCGVGALVLQANPWATPEQLVAHLTGNGSKDKIKDPDSPFLSWTQETANYKDNTTTLGSSNVMLYNIFNNPIPTNIC